MTSTLTKIILLVFFPIGLLAQSLTGTITDQESTPLPGVNVYWNQSTIGVTTDEDGAFSITTKRVKDKRLVISYVGFENDTILITNQSDIAIQLKSTQTLETIDVTADRPDAFISNIDPIKTEVITKGELAKGACCDLAGCFNTQGSVQHTTTNIVTDAKELRILGLSGVYNQILIDGMPLIQGLTYTYGISTIPGTLVENIYIAKGSNSVLQGFESISGQINVELLKPEDTDKFLFNAYVNSFLEKQFNINFSQKVKSWHTLISAHSTQPANKFDRDQDAFLDLPLLTRYSFYNKWSYGNPNEWGWHSRIGLRFVDEERIGGQKDFRPSTNPGTMNSYGQTVQFTQPEVYTKTGFRMDDRHHFVFIASAFHQDQNTYFGTSNYQARQFNGYANLQYELSWKEQHTLKAGFSYRYVDLEEDLSFAPDNLNRTYAGEYLKQEQIPGFFAENTLNWKDRSITLITGLRVDHHNDFGWFLTPRALFRFDLTENTTARVSAGTGWRTVNLFSENINLLASSRDIIITEQLEPEQAFNYGANLTHKIYGEKVESQISLDFYRTQFSNQIFPDYDQASTKAYISNFNGTSISNGFQAEVGFDLYDRVGIKVIYNYLDVFRMIEGRKFQLPFNSTHRVTSTFSYQPLHQKWHFDTNVHWYGKQQLANTTGNPSEFQLPETSKPFTVINAQLTRSWKRFEVYGGCENIFDFRQKRPILSWENPFGPYFDTASVWGPTRGREFYLGVRFTVE